MTVPQSRITIDIDSHVPNLRIRLLRAKSGLKRAGAYEVEAAVSSSGRGFHLTGYFDERIPLETQFRIRENLNDDPNRIKMDRQRAERGLPINTMWTKKHGNDGERQTFETIEDALAHVERTQVDPHTRMNKIQNNGHKAIIDAEIPKMSNISAI